jgi:hypothetical protein
MRSRKLPAWAALGLFLGLLFAPLAAGQSLAEAAKKEKERRESLKGKEGVTVTNADLANTKKKPAVTVPPPTPAEGEKTAAAKPAVPAAETAAPEPQAEVKKKNDEKKAEIEARLNKAGEMVELLTLKMTALDQQFHSFNSMTPKDQIQKAMSETYLKLQAAQADVSKIKDELNKFLAQAAKEKIPPAAGK